MADGRFLSLNCLTRAAETSRRLGNSPEWLVFLRPAERHKGTVQAMIRKAFVMMVKPGCEAEYRQRHSPIWPELEGVLKEHGVSSYSVFLHPKTRQLFAYAEIEDEARWKAIALTPVWQKWWAHMQDLVEVNSDGSLLAEGLVEMFHIEKAACTPHQP